MIYGALAIMALMLVDAMREFFPEAMPRFKRQHVVVRFASYAAIVMLIVTIGVFDGAQFIYFQF